MLQKQITYSSDARLKIKSGIDKLANAVKVTLGPKGRNVILDRGFAAPVVTKDGVTVAKEIYLEDRLENLGATLVKNVAAKTAEEAGDGTTTATVLAQAMVEEGMKYLAAGMNPQDLRRGMEEAVKDVVESIASSAVSVEDNATIRHIATISANDESIGTLIAQAMEEVGKDGVVTVEESKIPGVTVEITKGLKFDKGYVSPYFVTDQQKMIAEYEDPVILITDHKIESGTQLKPIVEKLQAAGIASPVVLIADEVRGDALQSLVVNRVKYNVQVLAVKAPSFGDRRRDVMEDIAVITGGKFITQEQGFKLENVNPEDLGRARRIIASAGSTTIVDGLGSQEAINARLEHARGQIEASETEYDKEKHRERVAKLAGGVATILVGAASETEAIEIKHRVEDAIAATKAAVEEGIVPGGGVALIGCLYPKSNKIGGWDVTAESQEKNNSVGYKIVMDSLSSPFLTIMANAGRGKESGQVLQKIEAARRTEKWGYGYDAAKGEEVENLIEAGIIDPAKVVRCAIQNAASAAIMILTTEAAVTDAPKEKEQAE